MGYYDVQAPNISSASRLISSGAKPYDVRDILLATEGASKGIAGIGKNIAENKKEKQQYEANQYVGNLLGKTDTSNYEQQSALARQMLPYASTEMAKQYDLLGKDIQAQRTYGLEQERNALAGINANTNIMQAEEASRANKANELLAKERLDQADRQYNSLSAADKARLGLEAQRVGISAKELLLQQNKAEQEKKAYQLLPQMQKVYDTKGKVVGEVPTYTRFNQYTGDIQQLGGGAKPLPPLK